MAGVIVFSCLNQFFLTRPSNANPYLPKDNSGQDNQINDQSGPYRDKEGSVSIPFRFLPNYKIQNDSNNKPFLINEEGKGELEVPTDELAIVLVDTWNSFDNDENPELVNCIRNVRELLLKCRGKGVTVIHAPNHPVVDKYPQYHTIKKEVENYLNHHSSKISTPDATFLGWPRENEYNRTIKEKRQEGRNAEYSIKPKGERDISKLLTPLGNEYVLATYNEFRYVLWKEKIKVILYVGGSLNECMLQCDTGINLLAGSDSKMSNFSIVVVEDCVFIMGTPNSGYEETKQAMLDYYKRKIAVVSNSQAMIFH